MNTSFRIQSSMSAQPKTAITNTNYGFFKVVSLIIPVYICVTDVF